MSGKNPVGRGHSGLLVSPWNLLLVLPLLMLITPWFNKDRPRVLGMPFFYWYQFLFVIVGVATTWIVYLATRRLRPAALTEASRGDHRTDADGDDGRGHGPDEAPEARR